jgi:methyl-accepting chemotaxis protein
MLLRDETLAGQVRQIVKNAEQASADLGQAARQADSMVSDLNSRGIPQKAADLIDSISDSARQVHQIISDVAKPDQNGTSAGENIRESLANAGAAASNLAEATEAARMVMRNCQPGERHY